MLTISVMAGDWQIFRQVTGKFQINSYKDMLEKRINDDLVAFDGKTTRIVLTNTRENYIENETAHGY